MGKLSGKTALITGGSKGIGRGIVLAFVKEGCDLLISSRNQDDLDRMVDEAREVAEHDLKIVTHAGDVGCSDSVDAMFEKFKANFDYMDLLVNNAGVGHEPTPLYELSEKQFDRIFQVNMRGIYLTSNLVVPIMKAKGQGCILNIASTAGVSPRPNLTWYNASKGWVITATKSMAIELAPFNIRVNAINPVAGETPLLSTFMGEDTPEMREKFLSTIPLGRFSTPEDIGRAAVYLCSDESSLVTGAALEIDGGRTI